MLCRVTGLRLTARQLCQLWPSTCLTRVAASAFLHHQKFRVPGNRYRIGCRSRGRGPLQSRVACGSAHLKGTTARARQALSRAVFGSVRLQRGIVIGPKGPMLQKGGAGDFVSGAAGICELGLGPM